MKDVICLAAACSAAVSEKICSLNIEILNEIILSLVCCFLFGYFFPVIVEVEGIFCAAFTQTQAPNRP